MLMNRWLEGIGSRSAGQLTGKSDVPAAAAAQVEVHAPLDEPDSARDESVVRPTCGGQPARDGDRRPPTGQFIESGLNRVTGLNGALAAGEAGPTRARNDVVPLRQTGDNAIDAGSTQCGGEVGIGPVGSSESQVHPKRVVEEVSVLSNQADCARHAVEGQLADVVSIEKYRTLVDVVKPRDEISKPGLTSSRFAADGSPRSRAGNKVDLVQRRRAVEPVNSIGVVPERPARHPNFASHRI